MLGLRPGLRIDKRPVPRDGPGAVGQLLVKDEIQIGVDGLPVDSCLMLAVEAEGCQLTTIEGIGTLTNKVLKRG